MIHLSLTGQVNRDELHRHFYNLGVGAIEEIRVQQEKGFGFVRYSTHGEAALAIQMANGLVIRGKPIKVFSKFCKGSPGYLNHYAVVFRVLNAMFSCSAHGATNQLHLGQHPSPYPLQLLNTSLLLQCQASRKASQQLSFWLTRGSLP